MTGPAAVPAVFEGVATRVTESRPVRPSQHRLEQGSLPGNARSCFTGLRQPSWPNDSNAPVRPHIRTGALFITEIETTTCRRSEPIPQSTLAPSRRDANRRAGSRLTQQPGWLCHSERAASITCCASMPSSFITSVPGALRPKRWRPTTLPSSPTYCDQISGTPASIATRRRHASGRTSSRYFPAGARSVRSRASRRRACPRPVPSPPRTHAAVRSRRKAE